MAKTTPQQRAKTHAQTPAPAPPAPYDPEKFNHWRQAENLFEPYSPEFNRVLMQKMCDPLLSDDQRFAAWLTLYSNGNCSTVPRNSEGLEKFQRDCARDTGMDRRRVSEVANRFAKAGYIELPKFTRDEQGRVIVPKGRIVNLNGRRTDGKGTTRLSDNGSGRLGQNPFTRFCTFRDYILQHDPTQNERRANALAIVHAIDLQILSLWRPIAQRINEEDDAEQPETDAKAPMDPELATLLKGYRDRARQAAKNPAPPQGAQEPAAEAPPSVRYSWTSNPPVSDTESGTDGQTAAYLYNSETSNATKEPEPSSSLEASVQTTTPASFHQRLAELFAQAGKPVPTASQSEQVCNALRGKYPDMADVENRFLAYMGATMGRARGPGILPHKVEEFGAHLAAIERLDTHAADSQAVQLARSAQANAAAIARQEEEHARAAAAEAEWKALSPAQQKPYRVQAGKEIAERMRDVPPGQREELKDRIAARLYAERRQEEDRSNAHRA